MLEPSGEPPQHGLRVAMVDRVEQLFQAAAEQFIRWYIFASHSSIIELIRLSSIMQLSIVDS
jgi:hypothetical protein